MRWFNTKELRSSIYALLSVGVRRPAGGDETTRTEDIRLTMLGLVELDGRERAE